MPCGCLNSDALVTDIGQTEYELTVPSFDVAKRHREGYQNRSPTTKVQRSYHRYVIFSPSFTFEASSCYNGEKEGKGVLRKRSV